MLVVLPSSVADVNAAGECYYDDTKDSIYVWKFGGGDPDASGGTPFILSRAAVFQQIDDESTTFGWGSVPGICCATPKGGAKRIKITGLDLRGGQPGVIFQNNAAVMDSSVLQHCHLSRGMYTWGQNGSVVFSDGVSATNGQYNGLVACSLGWGGTRPQTGSASWPGGMFTHGGAVTLYRQEHFHVDSCYFYGWAEFGVDYKMDGGAATEYRGNVVRYSIFNPNPESPQWERHALRMSVKQKKDSVYGCIFVDGDRNIFLQADGQQSGGAVLNDSSFICNNTFYNIGSFLYVGEFLAARCGVGHTVKWNLIHDYRPGAGFGGDIGVFSNNNYPTDQACVDVFGVIDYNVYYDPSSAFTFDKSDYGQGMSIAQWRTTPAFDVNSTVSSSSLLVDPAGGDYSPTSAVPSMNVNYAGKNWTRYGALQAAAGNICASVTVNLPTQNDTIAAYSATLDADFNDASGEQLVVDLFFEAGDVTPDIEIADTVLTADDDWVYGVTGLVEDFDYYRQYRVIDTAACTTWSAIYKFVVDSIPVTPPDTGGGQFDISYGDKIR
jgi:disulfide oxidoreductase YuzD